MGVVAGYNVAINAANSLGVYYSLFDITCGTYTANLGLAKSPTGNCQLTSFAFFNSLLAIVSKNEDVVAILLECIRLVGYTPRITLIDVREEYVKRTEACFDKNKIMLKHRYNSTNGSDMCLFQIKLGG